MIGLQQGLVMELSAIRTHVLEQMVDARAVNGL